LYVRALCKLHTNLTNAYSQLYNNQGRNFGLKMGDHVRGAKGGPRHRKHQKGCGMGSGTPLPATMRYGAVVELHHHFMRRP